MDQKKIGEFLKQLRKEKNLTQEQLAEHFYVSSRSISRWETGSNMPDVDMLIELADFYKVDIREIIEGERKSEKMDNETKDTLKKVAEYVTEERKKREKKLAYLLAAYGSVALIAYLLFGKEEYKGPLNGIVPEAICDGIMIFLCGVGISFIAMYILNRFGSLDKVAQLKKRLKNQNTDH